MSKKILFLLAIPVSLLLVITAIYYNGVTKSNSPSNVNIVASLVSNCQLASSQEVNPLFPLINSNNERCIKERIKVLPIDQQILIANSLLDTNLIDYCHAIIHGLGVEAFNKTKNIPDAIALGSPGCLYGFYHGVLSSAGEVLSPQEVISQSKSLCSNLPNPSEALHNCAHAIGHGVAAATHNDMEKGAPYCELLDSSFVRYQCLVGLLMEAFLTVRSEHPDGNFPAPFSTKLCSEESRGIDFQKACVNMFFILITQEKFESTDGTNGLRALCNEFTNSELKLECYHAIGTQSAQFLAFDPERIASQTCGNEIDEFSLSCARGAGLVYGMNYGFEKKQNYFCKLFKDEQAKACLSVTKADIFTI